MKNSVDKIIVNGKTWVTGSHYGQLVDTCVAISGGRFVELGNPTEILEKFMSDKVWDAKGQLLLPGFINTHCHLFQTFMRGMGKDLPFMDWMNSSVRLLMPLMDEESVYLAAMIGCLEAIRTGTTTIADFMYANVKPGLSDAVLRAFDDVGLRGILARGFTDIDHFPGSSTRPASWQLVEDTLDDLDRMQGRYSHHPRIGFMLAPSVIWAMTRDGLAMAGKYAREKGLVLTMHLLETPDDDQFSLEKYGKRTTRILEDLEVLNNQFLAVHAVRLKEEDIDLFEKYDVAVSHNPVANMILGSGAAPIWELTRRKVRISLGTDGAASNDSQNMIEVMKSAAWRSLP